MVSNKCLHGNPEKGQSLTEFAVSVVILLILLAGTVDAGRAFFTFMSLRDGQEGAL
jgi:Flp pilus assembly protein TadG